MIAAHFPTVYGVIQTAGQTAAPLWTIGSLSSEQILNHTLAEAASHWLPRTDCATRRRAQSACDNRKLFLSHGHYRYSSEYGLNWLGILLYKTR